MPVYFLKLALYNFIVSFILPLSVAKPYSTVQNLVVVFFSEMIFSCFLTFLDQMTSVNGKEGWREWIQKKGDMRE